ncbi:phage tail domain-containing protein [Listeria ilorinensis]|uniref:phage tail domain-containing protein n=1 Tax=Listeria ilorinensis TaxID=2867439 RepID=UPI001EF4C4FD|nr:phage tail domain-containing protein [Listeria ilorinensis]
MTDKWVHIDRTDRTFYLENIQGLYFLDQTLEDPTVSNAGIQLQGVDGLLPIKNTYAPLALKLRFFYEGKDVADNQLMMKDLRNIFHCEEPYIVRHSEMPGLRYLVSNCLIEQEAQSLYDYVFTITCNVYKGYTESFGTTLNPLTFEEEKWQVGLDLPVGEDLPYVFTSKSFKVYNASSIKVNPVLRHQLEVAMTCEGTPRITNRTTSDTFEYKKSLKKADTLYIQGVYPFVNNQHAGVNTNHGVITLAPGWNEFEITGADNINIAFNFRFIYRG